MGGSLPEPNLGLLLRLVAQHWGESVDAELRAEGLTGIRPPHANVFPFIGDDGVQVSELAARASVRKQSMAQTVEQLETAGYLERRPDPGDGRAKLVHLTDRGRAVRAVAMSTGHRVERDWTEQIGRDDLETLRAVLARLHHRLTGGGDVPE